MENIEFTFSDAVAGYVVGLDRDQKVYQVKTSDGRPFTVRLKSNTYALMVRNLDEPYIDCTTQLYNLLTPGRYVYTYGTYYPDQGGQVCEAQYLTLAGARPDALVFARRRGWAERI